MHLCKYYLKLLLTACFTCVFSVMHVFTTLTFMCVYVDVGGFVYVCVDVYVDVDVDVYVYRCGCVYVWVFLGV